MYVYDLGQKRQESKAVRDDGSYMEATAHQLVPGRCDAKAQAGVSVRRATLQPEGTRNACRASGLALKRNRGVACGKRGLWGSDWPSQCALEQIITQVLLMYMRGAWENIG
jgi:hypothetical protein